MISFWFWKRAVAVLLLMVPLASAQHPSAGSGQAFDGSKAYEYAREFAAIICPSPDPWTMCIYALPMLGLYLVGIAVAWWVHPARRRKKEAAG